MRKISIPSSKDVILEGEIKEPETFDTAIVICHPHPLFGGTMYNNVVDSLFNILPERGIMTLRFNFRGVGNSQGKYEGGVGEREDVNAAVTYLKTTFSKAEKIAVAGYSFGAWVGLLAASVNNMVDFMIAIAPPITLFNFNYLKNTKKPKLFIIGDSDDFTPLNDFLVFYEEIPNPKKYVILPGVDHFYRGHELKLAEIIVDFLIRKNKREKID